MRTPRIFTGQPLQADSEIQLEPGPSQHLARSLRMREGDAVILFDGRGGEYAATISALTRSSVSLVTGVHDTHEVESPLAIHLGISISRGDRMDWVVQKATELGVTRISPLFTERTEVKLRGERASKKIAHWQQVAISACEQCGRNRVPVVEPLLRLSDWLPLADGELKFVLHHRAEPQPEPPAPPASASLLVGPEGGLSASEIEGAEAAGFRSLRLGPRVLRTETAPLAALTYLQVRWGDLGPG